MHRRRVRSTVLLILVLLAHLSPALATSFEEVKERGELVVLTFPEPESPFFDTAPSGGYRGFDYDLLQAYARSIGVSLRVRDVPAFEGLLPALLKGEGDVIACGFTITAEREEVVDFTEPYFPVVTVVIVPSDSSVRVVEDLPGRTAAVLTGSSLEATARRLDGVLVAPQETTAEVYRSVSEGRADFALDDSPSAAALLADSPNLEVAFELHGRQNYAFAVAAGSTLGPDISSYLSTLKDGRMLYELVLRYFGSTGAELFQQAQ